jgi:ketosteroid isomerase-like protein
MSMRGLCMALVVLFLSSSMLAQNADEQEILGILGRQTQAWNRGDLRGFMNGYWESDSLMYIGKGGVTYGFARTLQRYEQNYGDTARMGKLSFQILHLLRLSDDHYYVVGKWSLKRSAGDVGGHYTLLWRKIRGQWVIVADHSS